MRSTSARSARLMLAAVTVSGLLLAAPAAGQGAVRVLTPVVIWIPPEWHTGGAYTAIQADPEGRVYLGTTFYEGFGRFLVLPTGAREFQVITDMAAATGETRPGPDAQAKIHTKPAVAPDGKVYFGTKSGERATEAASGSYPGGHLLVYDPATGKVTDLGIPRPRQSIIAVGIDSRRNIVYAVTDPEVHLITYDVRRRAYTDRGQFSTSYPPSRYLVVLANGDAYHHAGADAYMRYDAASGRIGRVPLEFVGRGTYEVPYAVTANREGTAFYGVGQESGQVYTFAPEGRALTVRRHGAALPEGMALPGSHYTITSAPDGNAYYTGVFARRSVLFLERLAARAGVPEVVGRVGDLPPPPYRLPRPPRGLMVQGSTAGPDGTLYVMLAYPLRILVFPRLASP